MLNNVAFLHPFELSEAQLNEFLSRNWTLPEVISNAIQTGYWPNGQELTAGYAVTDSVFGNVLLSADARGFLHYIANEPQRTDATNAPYYESPSGNTFAQTIADFVAGLKGYATVITVGVLGYLFFVGNRR